MITGTFLRFYIFTFLHFTQSSLFVFGHGFRGSHRFFTFSLFTFNFLYEQKLFFAQCKNVKM